MAAVTSERPDAAPTAEPPSALTRRHPGDWHPVDLGRSPARVWRVEGHSPVYVKAVWDDGSPGAALAAAELEDEADRCMWLATNDFPVPNVLGLGFRRGLAVCGFDGGRGTDAGR